MTGPQHSARVALLLAAGLAELATRQAATERPRVRIVRAVQTCWGCPSQWDAWTDTGAYLYLRFRYGYGSATWYAIGYPDHRSESRVVAEFKHGDDMAGVISLAEFCELAGIERAPEVW